MVLHNWAGNHRYRATAIDTPSSVAELALLVASSNVKAIGTRHTFSDIGDGERLVSTSGLGERFVVAADRRSVRVDGSMTYARLCELLRPEGLALGNLASLAHISIAGAVSTATHGSGRGNGNLATAVQSITLVSPTGTHAFTPGDDAFPGAVVGVGSLGIITELTLAVEPTYDVAQTVYRGVDWADVTGRPETVFGAAYSVSLFTRYGADPGELWVKRRVGVDGDELDLSGLVEATDERHPIPDHPAASASPQHGVAGPWNERLPHFRASATPSSGAEIQSEYFVAWSDAGEAIDAVRSIGKQLDDVLMVGEIRTVAADRLWLSPQCDGPTLAFHFTWIDDPARVAGAVAQLEHALAPFAPRPHWGKYFTAELDVASKYAALDSFLALQRRLDPQGLLRTPWFDRTLTG